MTTYPPTVGGLIFVSVGVTWAALSSLYSLLIGNLLGFVGSSASATAGTIGEAQPPLQNAAFSDFFISQYGLSFFLALGAIVYILARPLYDSDEFTDYVYIVSTLALVGSVYAVPHLYEAIGGLVATFRGGGADPPVTSLLIRVMFGAGGLAGLFTNAHAVRRALESARPATSAFLVSPIHGALRAPVLEVSMRLAEAGESWATTLPRFGLAALLGTAGLLAVDRYAGVLEY